MYKVQATSGHSSTREEMFTNLNQVYGFLVGVIAAYRQHHPSLKFFRRWYQARCRRGVGASLFLLDGEASFQIEKVERL